MTLTDTSVSAPEVYVAVDWTYSPSFADVTVASTSDHGRAVGAADVIGHVTARVEHAGGGPGAEGVGDVGLEGDWLGDESRAGNVTDDEYCCGEAGVDGQDGAEAGCHSNGCLGFLIGLIKL
jgi:hypothetical protein